MEVQASEIQATLEQLQEQHRQAEQRLRELDRHVWLSPEEQIELAKLKKEKLQLKDRMRNLLAQGS
jgi:uncharacterized protein YdcH (DUF465 family)